MDGIDLKQGAEIAQLVEPQIEPLWNGWASKGLCTCPKCLLRLGLQMGYQMAVMNLEKKSAEVAELQRMAALSEASECQRWKSGGCVHLESPLP